MDEQPAPISPEPIVPEHVMFMLIGVLLMVALVWLSLP
jgi:hypothetical protein